MKILSKHFDCSVFCLLCQFVSDLTLDSRSDQTVVTVCDCLFQHRCRIWILCTDHLSLKISQNIFFRCFHLHCQEFLFLTTVQCKNSMSCKLRNGFFKLIIHLIDRLCLRILRLGSHLPFSHCRLPDPGSVNCLIRNAFRNDITRSADCVLCTFHTFFFRNICFCHFLKRLFCLLQCDQCRQWLKSFLLRDCRTGAALRAIRTIQVLYCHKRFRCQNLFL